MCKFNISGRGRSVSKREKCEKCPVYDRKQSLRLKSLERLEIACEVENWNLNRGTRGVFTLGRVIN